MNYWDVLGIQPTIDKKEIKKAYIQKLKIYHPEEDQEGFKKLREAYEKALDIAKAKKKISSTLTFDNVDVKEDFIDTKKTPQHKEGDNVKDEIKVVNIPEKDDLKIRNNDEYDVNLKDLKNELKLLNNFKYDNFNNKDYDNEDKITDNNSFTSPEEQFMNMVLKIYKDFFSRISLDKWKELLEKENFLKLDIKEKLSNTMLDFLRYHYNLPHSVWKLLDDKFSWTEQENSLSKKFSKDFINQVMQAIHFDTGLGYDFFTKDLSFNFDKFIRLRREAYDALTENRIEEAYEPLKAACKLFSKDPYLIRLLGIYYLKINDLKNALEAFNSLIEINPQDIDGLLNRGEILKKYNMIKEASRDYNKALEIDPDNLKALEGLAECYFNLKYHLEAKTLYEQIYDESPYNIDAGIRIIEINNKLVHEYLNKISIEYDNDILKLELSNIYFELNLFEECFNIAKSISCDFEALDEVNLLIGKALREQGKWNEAIIFFGKALSIAYENGSDEHNILRERGKAYLELKKYGEAISDLEKVLKYSDSDDEILYMLGKAYRCRKKYDKAISLLNNAIKKNPNRWQYYSDRGIAYYREKMYKEAINDHIIVIKSRSNFAEARYRQGYCYLQLGEYEEAINCLKKALDLGEKFYKDEHLRIALAYFKLENFNSALTEVKAYIINNPQNCFGYILEGDIQRALGNLKEAEAAYFKAHSIKPQSNLLTYLLVKMYLATSEYEKAHSLISRAIEINEKDQWLLKNMILVDIQLKNWSKAEKSINQFNKFSEESGKIKSKAQIDFFLGIIKYQYDFYEEALKLFNEAEKAGMKSSDLWSYTSMVCYDLKHMKDAEAYAKKALDAEPSDMDYENRYKGILQCKTKNWFIGKFVKNPLSKELWKSDIPIKYYEFEELSILNISIGENNEKNL